jgi:hypothetical protein
MAEGPDLKSHVRFSDNPKMDNSGISVNQKQEMWMGNADKPTTVKGPVVTGGQIREAAIAAGTEYEVVITDMASLKKIAALVTGGSSVHGAANDVAREYAFMERGRESDGIYLRGY